MRGSCWPVLGALLVAVVTDARACAVPPPVETIANGMASDASTASDASNTSDASTASDASISTDAGTPSELPFVAPSQAQPAAPLGIIRLEARDRGAREKSPPTPATTIGLSPERARLLLRSLTIPGWGQATVGRNRSAEVFGLAELSVWTSFTAFRIQSQMRRNSYERTARLFAGIDIKRRDEEFRRIIGSYLSSDEYNQLVVYRDAANLYYDNPQAYRAYIAQHSIGGRNAWSWDSEQNLLRYRSQRKDAQRAAIRANTALACAVVNRLLSMIHAARIPTHASTSPRSWNFEVIPAPGDDALAYRMGVRASF